MHWFVVKMSLCLIIFLLLSTCPSLCSLASHSNSITLCHSSESLALINFRNSFPIITYDTCDQYPFPNSPLSWDLSHDCCEWSGVQCDEMTGHVIGLCIGCGGLRGVLDSSNTLFSLTHLRTLDLSLNRFKGSSISPDFGKFQNLSHLDLSHCGFVGRIPPELSHLSNLLTLSLSANRLDVETHGLARLLESLTSLEELSMLSMDMSNVSPNIFSNLSTLRKLVIGNNGIKGEFPNNICNFPNLEFLDLNLTPNLKGLFPQHNCTSPLKKVDLSSTRLLIDLPSLVQNLKHLNFVSVKNCSFLGHFPDNPIKIPWTTLSTESLIYLDFSENHFSGQLPEICNDDENFLCDYSSTLRRVVGPIPQNLQTFLLENNCLHGSIPSWLYRLPSLLHLNLGGNQFTGRINEFRHNSLQLLDFGSNRLHGPFPASIFRQVNLSELDLSSNNLSGFVALQRFSKLEYLENLELSFNRLSIVVSSNNNNSQSSNYTLPSLIWKLALSSCNITEFPRSLRNLEKLESLQISNNRIEGIIPEWFWNVTKDSMHTLNISHNLLTQIGSISQSNKLQHVDFQSNRLQGRLPILPHSTTFFSVTNNQLFGDVSTLICNLKALHFLDLSNNKFSGKVSPCTKSVFSGMTVLDLGMNKFEGEFPLIFAKGSSLRTLNLAKNEFEGQLPPSLINCKNLEVLNVGSNKFNGSFPTWLESLPNLRVLNLRANKFSGQIGGPKTNATFQKLTIIDVSYNDFAGTLPAMYFANFAGMMNASSSKLEYIGQQYYQDSVKLVCKGHYFELEKIQKLLVIVDFSNNKFIGDIPHVIGKLRSLKGLNFSHNRLTGLVPPSLGNLTNLEFLDLSSNEFFGKIPQQLASNLYQLQILNLSHNNLEGQIPSGSQFDTFNKDSFFGNYKLCGRPLPNPCTNKGSVDDDDDDTEYRSNSLFCKKSAVIGWAGGFVIGISIGYVVFFGGRFDYWLKKKLGIIRRQNVITSVRPCRRASN